MLYYRSQRGAAASDSVCTSLVLWKLCPPDARPSLSGRDVGIDGAMSRRRRTSSRSEMTRCETTSTPLPKTPLSQTLQTPVVASFLPPSLPLYLAHSHTFLSVLHPVRLRLKIPRSISPCNACLVFENELSAPYPCPFLHCLFFHNMSPLSKNPLPLAVPHQPPACSPGLTQASFPRSSSRAVDSPLLSFSPRLYLQVRLGAYLLRKKHLQGPELHEFQVRLRRGRASMRCDIRQHASICDIF